MSATAKDIAARLGISRSSVSKILTGNGNGSFSEETRRRVLAVAAEVNYRPNPIARALRSARLNTIGVSLHSMGSVAISNPYANQVLQGIVQAAHNARYNVTLVQNPWNDESGSLEEFRADLVDGMIVVAPGDDRAMIPDLVARDVPVVAVSAPGEICGVPTVDVDNVRGARFVMDHLLRLGHTQIAFLMWVNPRMDAIVRRDTMLAAMAEAGLAVPPEYIRTNDPEDIPDYVDVVAASLDSDVRFEFYKPAVELLSLPNRPTAVFAGDDRIAHDVLLAARDLGISVPNQLSVVGFDDLPDAVRFDPPLTTVRQPLAKMGAAASELLLAILSGQEAEPRTHWFEPELIVRKSTAPPEK